MPAPNTAVSGTSPPTHAPPPHTDTPAPSLTKNDRPAAPRKPRTLRVPRGVRRAVGPVGLLLVWFLASSTGVLPESVLASPSMSSSAP